MSAVATTRRPVPALRGAAGDGRLRRSRCRSLVSAPVLPAYARLAPGSPAGGLGAPPGSASPGRSWRSYLTECADLLEHTSEPPQVVVIHRETGWPRSWPLVGPNLCTHLGAVPVQFNGEFGRMLVTKDVENQRTKKAGVDVNAVVSLGWPAFTRISFPQCQAVVPLIGAERRPARRAADSGWPIRVTK